MKRVLVFAATIVLIAALQEPARAGQADASGSTLDARWLPWIGCWRPAGQRPLEEGVHVCVVPAAAGVRILTLAGDKTLVDDTLVADGTPHAIDEPDCTGTRRAEWSADGQWLFSNAEVTCDRERRNVSGLTLLGSNGDWIDVQVVAASDRENVRVRRYQRSSDTPPEVAPIPAVIAVRASGAARGSRLTIDHIKEASSRVSARVLEALLFETKTAFPIDSRQLIALDDAGVPDTVIDLMVAYTFPKKFEVKRSSSGSGGFGWGGVGWSDLGALADTAYPWYLDPYYSFYSPFAYGYGPWNGFYFPPGGAVIVPDDDLRPEGHGRVVNRAGYTQVVPRAAEHRGEAAERIRSASGDSSSRGSDGGSNSGSSGVSSGGYSSGGGGDSGRTAVPR